MLGEFLEAREDIKQFLLRETMYNRGNIDCNGLSLIQESSQKRTLSPFPTLSRINVLNESRLLEMGFHGLQYEPHSTMLESQPFI